MNKKSLLVTALAVFALTAFSTASVFVASADEVEAGKKLDDRPDKEEMQEMHEAKQAMMEEVDEVLESGDYDGWIDLMIDMGRDEAVEAVTEDEFPQFLEAHELMGEARELMEDAGEIMSDIGLEEHGLKGVKGMKGKGMPGGESHGGDSLPTE